MRFFDRMMLAALMSATSALAAACGGESAGDDGGGAGGGAGHHTPIGDRELAFSRVSLPEVGGLAASLYDLASAGGAAWATAYSVDAAMQDNGPMVLWEKRPGGDFTPAILPPTTIAYFPDVCAASEDEAYVLVEDGAEQRARLFVRGGGEAPAFDEQPAPEAPDGWHFNVMRLACFPGGELWAHGAAQKGDDIYSQVYALFHRTGPGAAWEAVPVPEDLPPTFWSVGVSLFLLGADGSGYVGFSMGEEARIYARASDGAWTLAHGLGDEVFQISGASGDPAGDAVAVAQPKGEEGIALLLRDGVWSTETVPGASELLATAVAPGGDLVLGGTRYVTADDSITGAEAVLLDGALRPLTTPLRGRIHAMTFLSESGYLGLDFTEDPADTGLYELTFVTP